ncbi:hypothetical protein FQU76_05775 [Streptomyces qinzhouensis]|uniref:Uncharacterized protein n=1 Tax=Streptomyces qinzhouensis TaxID=2599401 RepID=A0A5B8J2W1_9ACTN|nr:hypothetical protein FQU76_05775 [Streptomyces qinzhouensis]
MWCSRGPAGRRTAEEVTPVLTIRRTAPLLAAPLSAVVLLWAGSGAASGRAGADGPGPSAYQEPRTYEADCRTEIAGSRVTAYCHNPYPVTDRVRLHVECDRWWDVDADGTPSDIGPAGYVELTDRCWKEVRAVWVTHQPFGGG